MLSSYMRGVYILTISFLVQSSLAKPQYFPDRDYYYPERRICRRYESYFEGAPSNVREHQPNYNNYLQDHYIPNGWSDVDEDSTSEISDAFLLSEPLNPPIYPENRFNPGKSESENTFKKTTNDIVTYFDRRRSDIEAEKDGNDFQGYFYPKPVIPFHLPDFKMVSASAEGDSAMRVTVVATSGGGESSEKTTTVVTKATEISATPTTSTTSPTTLSTTPTTSTASTDKV